MIYWVYQEYHHTNKTTHMALALLGAGGIQSY